MPGMRVEAPPRHPHLCSMTSALGSEQALVRNVGGTMWLKAFAGQAYKFMAARILRKTISPEPAG